MPSLDSKNTAVKPPKYWPKARRHLKNSDPAMARIISFLGKEALRPREDAFFSLSRAIIGQQISVKAAESIWNRMESALGGVSAVSIDRVSAEALRECGVTRQKSGYLVSLAEHFLAGEMNIAAWHGWPDDDVIGQLTKVKGIGKWTAEMFMIFHMLRPDVLPVGDIGIQRAMGNIYLDGERPTPEQMVEIAEPWRPWRSAAVWYLWRSLDSVPVEY